MMIETLAQAHKATPFLPFELCLADGRIIPVPHPEFMSYTGKSRMVHVINEEGTWGEWIDLLLIVSLRTPEPARWAGHRPAEG